MGATPKRGILLLVCERTSKEINSGTIYHVDDLERARKTQLHLHCPHCGQAHLFKFSDARLAPLKGR